VRAGPLAEGLDRLGWRTITARGPYAALAALGDLPIEAVIVDLASAGPDTQSLARRLKAAVAPRRLPVIAIGEPDGIQQTQTFDLTLSPPLHPSQAALRLESLVRTAIAEEEFELRLETFGERGRRMDLPEPQPSPFKILAVGEPAPQFLALSNALKRSGAEVVGAFTAYTAFDYLHERSFDSVVLWAGDNQQEALSIAAGMRRNTRLFHIPAMLYLKAESYVTMSEAFHRGVSDVASPETPEVETARRVMELARNYRRGESIRGALEKARSSGLMDAATGLFTRDLFAAHLARLTGAARERARPLSICVLRVADKPETVWARPERLAGPRHSADRLDGRPAGPRRGHRRPPGARSLRLGSSRHQPGRRPRRRRTDRRRHRLHRLRRRRGSPAFRLRVRHRRRPDRERRRGREGSGARRRPRPATRSRLRTRDEPGTHGR
jgi:two-component system cell cycle response regulator PopA